ncbi:MAG TPA: CHRD domain-containing protein [Polyangia bacterium]|jgi:hypothetical protein
MRVKLGRVMMRVVLGGGLVAGALGGASCSSDSGGSATGAGGTGGADAGALPNMAVFSMQMSGSQVVPATGSVGTGTVTVMLDRGTGAVTITGSFLSLSSNAIAAHLHGPAAAGQNAEALIPLMVPATTSGTISGNGTMTASQTNDMAGGMTYVDVHSTNFPDGEIRAQVQP